MANTTNAIKPIRLSAAQAKNFWSKVETRGKDQCWEWRGHKAHGYGKFTINRRKANEQSFLAHRVAYTLENGSIPAGKFACHSCDNPGCVNPAHLWPGTHSENIKDCWDKGLRVMTNAVGSKNPNAKLTEDDVRRIRSEYRQIRGQCAEIARVYGVTTSAIQHIIERRKWRHV